MDFVEEQGVSIIAAGSFNPAIFQPSWLSKNEIITAEEEEAVKLDVVHAEISQFEVPGLRFDVQTERFAMHAAAEPFVRAADIFHRLFGNLLSHTPLESAGINYYCHFRLMDWKQRHRFGRSMAPVEPWGDFGALMESEQKEKVGGFSTLVMRCPFPDYGKSGHMNIALQPSVKIPNDSGVFINLNHHFTIEPDRSGELPQIVTDKFDDCIAYSRRIVNHLTELGRSL